MRKCPYCKIDIEGDLVKCPLCQSKLMGTEEKPVYPKLEAQKKRSMLYKMQLFIAWVALIVGVGLDFTVKLRLPGHPDLHWSLLLAMWLFVIEFFIIRQFKPGTGPAGKMTKTVVATVVMWCITAHYLGLEEVTLDLVVPSVLAATGIANFVLALIDKHGNTMAYLLSGLLLSLIPSLIEFFVRDSMPLAWAVCLMISIILFAGAVIFRGKAVAAELQRRFHV